LRSLPLFGAPTSDAGRAIAPRVTGAAQVHLRIVENEEELDDEDRALLHREIDLSRAEAASGTTVSAEEALAALRAGRRG
jgi:hypothetical protein